MSGAATKCQVGRMTCVLRISPALLRLHGAKPCHQVRDRPLSGSRNALVVKSEMWNLGQGTDQRLFSIARVQIPVCSGVIEPWGHKRASA
jgi:hypothetical protein